MLTATIVVMKAGELQRAKVLPGINFGPLFKTSQSSYGKRSNKHAVSRQEKPCAHYNELHVHAPQ